MRLKRLDGLRTIAVLLVILGHHLFIRFGHVGVDLFFVLSGYLITGILRRARDKKDFWSAFYLKRATRILPPVVALILITFLVTHNAKVSSALNYLFFLGGWEIVTKNTIPVITNLWSLAVEEHFYLFWPFAIRFLPRGKLKWILIAVLVAEPFLRLFAVAYLHKPGVMVYFLTPFRLDGLALGSMLALLLEQPEWETKIKRWSLPLAGLSTALYTGLCFWIPSFYLGSNGALFGGFSYTIISFGMVGLLAYVLLNAEALLSRVLAWGPLVWLGTISYGLYLFDNTIEAVTARLLHTPAYPIPTALHRHMLWYDLPLTVLVAWLSFRFYEHPITLWGKRKADGNVDSETIPLKTASV